MVREPFIQIIRVRVVRSYGKGTLYGDYKGEGSQELCLGKYALQIIRVRVVRNYDERTLHTDYKGDNSWELW